jgi:hypothetical protein
MDVQKALGNAQYTLSQLRCDLSKLRSKGLLWRCPGTQTYQLGAEGYRIAIYYLKLYQKLYAPLTAAILDPVPADNQILSHRQTKLDRTDKERIRGQRKLIYVSVRRSHLAGRDRIGAMERRCSPWPDYPMPANSVVGWN